MFEESGLARLNPPLTQNKYDDDKADGKYYFEGDQKYPSTLRAFRHLNHFKEIKNFLEIWWVCRLKQSQEYDKMINNFRNTQTNIPAIPPIKLVAIENMKALQYQRHRSYEIWFSSEEIYQEFKAMDWKEFSIEFIYFNPKDQEAKLTYNNKRDNNQWLDVSYGTNTIQKLAKSYFYRAAFPNFKLLCQLDEIQDLVQMTLQAMVSQENQTQLDIQRCLNLVVSNWGRQYSKSQILQFQKIYHKQNILTIYATSPFFYRFLNTYLKITSDPMQLYYVQPFVSKMYREIKSLHRIQKRKNRNEKLIFYRGTWVGRQQIKYLFNNIGKIVRFLGFMSTSSNKNVAMGFAKNAIVTVIVNNMDRDEENDHGFADISESAKHNRFELQTLFNLLCQFRINNVEQVNGIVEIELIYIETAKIKKKQQKLLQDNQKFIQSQLIYDLQSGSPRSQSEIFMKCGCYNTARIYFEKMLQKILGQAHQVEIVKVRKNLIGAYLQKNLFKLAGQQIKQIKKKNDSLVLRYEGDVNFGLQLYEKADQFYQKAIQLQKQKIETLVQQPFSDQLKTIFNGQLAPHQQDLNVVHILRRLSETQLKININNFNKAKQYSRKALLISSQLFDARSQRFSVQFLRHYVDFEDFDKCFKQTVQQFLMQIQEGKNRSFASYIRCLILKAILLLLSQKFDDASSLIKESECLYSQQTQNFFSSAENGDFYYFKGLFFSFLQKNNKEALQSYQTAIKFYKQFGRQKTVLIAIIKSKMGEIKSQQAKTKQEAKELLKQSLSLSKQLAEVISQNKTNICKCFKLLLSQSMIVKNEIKQLQILLEFFIGLNTQTSDQFWPLYLDFAKQCLRLNQIYYLRYSLCKYQSRNPPPSFEYDIVNFSLKINDEQYKEAYNYLKERANSKELQLVPQRVRYQFNQLYKKACKHYGQEIISKIKLAQNLENGLFEIDELDELTQQDLKKMYSHSEEELEFVQQKKMIRDLYIQNLGNYNQQEL